MKYNKADIITLIESNDPLVEFTEPHQTARSSPFWSSFKQVFYNQVKQDLIRCNFCKSILIHKSTHGTKVMSTHIKACKQRNTLDCKSKSKDMNGKQISSSLKKSITDACVEFAVLDNRAFETVDGDGFINLMEKVFAAGQKLPVLPVVQVKEIIPDPTTISRNIDQIYQSRKDQLINWCQSIDDYCITVDFWTESYTGIHFGGVSLHHIDQNNILHVFILGCYPYDETDQKAPNVRTFVDKVLEEYTLKLDDKKYVVTDNENKMKATFNNQCKRIGCSSHYLNKQLEHAFLSEKIDKQIVPCVEVQSLFKNIKALVVHIRRSHKQLKLKRKLQIYSDTRFNGAFYMLNVFLIVFDDLYPIINSTHIEHFINLDKDLLEEVCNFLIPFDQVFTELSATNRPTLHRVIPLRQYLLNRCEIKPEDHHGIQKLKQFLKQRIETAWILADEHYLATIVHPRLKNFQMMSSNDRKKAISLLKCAVECRANLQSTSSFNLPRVVQSITTNSTLDAKAKQPEKQNLLLQCFDQESIHVPAHVRECEEYLNSTVDDKIEDDDILQYWEKYKTHFPNVHAVARKVLSIPASNTEVERLFSNSKMVMTDKRTRLDPEKLNKMLFLRKNLHSLKQLDEQRRESQKRKSFDKSLSDNEDEQVTPSISKKSKTDNNYESAEDELKD